ncbi:TPA: XRE family transcriptional regulator, partial [Streptococcus pyogenes]|nr:XRE family transcriptional regulator [Streptococcus pyogenes]
EFIREDTNKIVFNVRFSDKQERKIYNEISSKNESYMFSSKITDSISSLILKDFKIQFLNYDDENLDETDKEVFLEFCQKDFEMSGLLSLPF